MDYDDCIVPTNSFGNIICDDGEDECWYILNARWEGVVTHIPYDACYHLSHEIYTIKYYFNDSSQDDPNYTWVTDPYKEYIKTMSHEDALIQAEAMAIEIKNAYADSMKKWNNIYYFTHSEDGSIQAHKIINVEEGTQEDHNLTIYPIDYRYIDIDHKDNVTYMANCGPKNLPNDIPTWQIGIVHEHYYTWEMNVNVNYFYPHGYIGDTNPEYSVGETRIGIAFIAKEMAGQHELGHVLGLQDIDSLCSSSSLTDHHEEVLMGYGDGGRSIYAKYKDIAGVAITRGLHTDSDHIWMLRSNTDGTEDVICAQCNGVKYDIELTNGQYEGKSVNVYKSCIHHGGTNENMLLVATDGTRNFFKCQYCRHIEEVDISAFSTATKYSGFVYTNTVLANQEKYHKVVVSNSETYTLKSDVSGLFTIELYDSSLNNTHKISNDIFGADGCAVSLTAGTYYLRIKNNSSYSITPNISFNPPPHIHNYTEWAPYSSTQHIECCECGVTGTIKKNHVIKSSETTLLKSKCLICGALVDATGGFGESFIQNIQKVTINGSYILPNGIIVLVDEDIEAYLNGTLVFYDKNNVPQTQ